MKLYLDDERTTPQGWHRAFTAPEAIALLTKGGVEEISLDHDLGPPEAGTGYQVAKWIENRVAADVNYLPPKMSIHSANPVGRQNIQGAIDSIKRILTSNLIVLGILDDE